MTGLWAITAGIALTLAGIAAPAAAQTTDPAPEVTIAAAGDIACSPLERPFNAGLGTPAGCRQKAVADVVRSMNPAAFLAVGDIQQHDGTYDEFMASYEPAFGDLKPITYPVPGNHEYNTPGGAGYYQYFGASAQPATASTYSFNVGSWHVIAINSTQCTPARPCGPGSAMSKWIAADVAANPTKCLAAFWHHPVYSAGQHGNNAPMVPVWNQLHSYGADLVLNGHDHSYQRSKPLGQASLTSTGTVADPVVSDDGMRQFIVATGGQNNFTVPSATSSQAAIDAMAVTAASPNPAVFGALRLRLGDGRYDFDFVPAEGVSFTDSGQAACRTKTPPIDVPAKPTVSVMRTGDGAVNINWTAQRWADRLPVTYTARLVGRAKQCVSTQTSCAISGLTNGQTYSVVVTASNDIADVLSEPVSFIPATRPSRPGIPTAAVTGDRIAVSWPASAYNGGLPVTYTATASPGGRKCTSATTSCTLTVATAGTYTVSVVASNEAGTSLAVTSTPVTVTAPDAATITSVARAGDGKITVSLSPGANAAQWLGVDYLVTSSPSTRTCTTTGTSCTVTGLTNGTSYTFTAVMRTATMRSAASAPSTGLIAARVPARTAAPTVVAAGPGAVTLTWPATTYNGGLPVTGYEALVGNGPQVVCRTTALTCTATGLQSGSTYWFTVVAINDAGRSANSPGSAVIRVQ